MALWGILESLRAISKKPLISFRNVRYKNEKRLNGILDNIWGDIGANRMILYIFY